MATTFPDYPALVQEPYVWEPRFKTYMGGPYGSENVVTRPGIAFALHSASVIYKVDLWPTIGQLIFEHFALVKGRYENFWFRDILGWDYSPVGILWGPAGAPTNSTAGQFWGVAAAAQTQFSTNIRAIQNDANRAVYRNGVKLTSGVTWGGTGTAPNGSGADMVTIPSSTAGDIISGAGVGTRIWNAKYGEDKLSYRQLGRQLVEITVPLVEVP